MYIARYLCFHNTVLFTLNYSFAKIECSTVWLATAHVWMSEIIIIKKQSFVFLFADTRFSEYECMNKIATYIRVAVY